MIYNKIQQLTPDLLRYTMEKELYAIVFYQQLKTMTKDKQNISLIQLIIKDEEKHLSYLEKEYQKKTGQCLCLPQPKVPYICSFVEGIKQAILDELEAFELYRDIYLSGENFKTRDCFFDLMTDENEHAIKYNYMYSKVLESILLTRPSSTTASKPTLPPGEVASSSLQQKSLNPQGNDLLVSSSTTNATQTTSSPVDNDLTT